MALVKYNNNSISAVTATASIPSGALTLIKTLTASSSATLSFVHGTDGVVLDSTYPIYKFEFINCHPASSTELQFQTSIDGGSNYNVTLTSTNFYAYHTEADSAAALTYYAGGDQAQGTAFQRISRIDNANDSSGSGELTLYNPSSTTFVKHYMSNFNEENQTYSQNQYTAGYFNTTSAINAVRFKMGTGNIDAGKIKLYGIKDS
jgi:hypothetical protein